MITQYISYIHIFNIYIYVNQTRSINSRHFFTARSIVDCIVPCSFGTVAGQQKKKDASLHHQGGRHEGQEPLVHSKMNMKRHVNQTRSINSRHFFTARSIVDCIAPCSFGTVAGQQKKKDASLHHQLAPEAYSKVV